MFEVSTYEFTCIPIPSSYRVPSLDHILPGGLTKDRIYLVKGDPGTGKTTLAKPPGHYGFFWEWLNRGGKPDADASRTSKLIALCPSLDAFKKLAMALLLRSPLRHCLR